METSNPHRPVPATDEIMQDLPREVLEIGCELNGTVYIDKYIDSRNLVFSVNTIQGLRSVQRTVCVGNRRSRRTNRGYLALPPPISRALYNALAENERHLPRLQVSLPVEVHSYLLNTEVGINLLHSRNTIHLLKVLLDR